jgi:hypothetical protein
MAEFTGKVRAPAQPIEKLDLEDETRRSSLEAASHVSAKTPFGEFPRFSVGSFHVLYSERPNARFIKEGSNEPRCD